MKPLNLEDALHLASILSAYVDVNELNSRQDALDFIDDIVKKISPQDFLHCVKMMTKKTEEDLEKMTGYDILALFSDGLRENRVISLLDFYKSLGF